MMQSEVVNGDIQQVESLDDYILVQQPGETHDDLLDDESYDYCEDTDPAEYTGTNTKVPKDVVVPSDLVENLNEANAAYDLAPISVPPVLMKDLDEAHAAAKLAQIPDLEQRSVSSTVSYAKSVHDEPSEVGGETTAGKNTAGKVTAGKEKVSLSNQRPITMSRASNKKRRKKLKLMKKAQAAASAAQALSEKAKSGARTGQKTSKAKVKASSGRVSRKVGNIAVVCATQTLAAYREEVLRNKQQCV